MNSLELKEVTISKNEIFECIVIVILSLKLWCLQEKKIYYFNQ